MASFFPLIILVALFALGVPIAMAMIISVIPYFLVVGNTINVNILIQRMVATSESMSLLAIPFFITAGTIMNYSGITRRLLDLADTLVGHLRGGLGHVNVLLSAMMGGLSGSCAADAAQECKILVPEMVKRGYGKPFCAAVTAASSLITPIIPPGIGLVIYAFLVNASVGRMFMGGYLPGLLLAAGMMLLVAYLSKKRNYAPSRQKRASAMEISKQILKSLWALGLPVLLIVGLRMGMFTATEGGAQCALYALLVGKFVYKELDLKQLPAIMREAALSTCTVMLVMCAANAFAFYASWERLPQMCSAFLTGVATNKYIFLLLANVLFLILGMFIEGTASMIILVPMIYPTAVALGIDPIHFGVVMCLNIAVGAITPPFGVIIYLVAPLMKLRVADFIRELMPFIGVCIAVLLLITFVPALVTFLPNLVF